MEARYGSDDVFETRPTLRLATHIVNRNAAFSDDVWKKGHTVPFDGEADHSFQDTANLLANPPRQALSSKAPSLRYVDNPSDIEDLMHEGKRVSPPREPNILAWLRRVYNDARGFELGSFDASLLPTVWKKQSANWENLALGYINDVVALVHTFILTLLGEICGEEHLFRGVYDVMFDYLMERYKKAIEHAKFVLNIERSGTPMTTNHYFADNLEKR